jgi:hypothetical protein
MHKVCDVLSLTKKLQKAYYEFFERRTRNERLYSAGGVCLSACFNSKTIGRVFIICGTGVVPQGLLQCLHFCMFQFENH